MEIRRPRGDELAEVGRLTVQAYVDDGFVTLEDAYLDELADAARRDREAEVWVAVEDGRLLGSVTFAPSGSPYQETARPGEGEFRMLSVGRAGRGRGVGRALVEHCIARSRDLGYVALRMCSLDTMAAAHRVYTRLGFVRVPDDDWEPAPGFALRAFVLPLTGGDGAPTGAAAE